MMKCAEKKLDEVLDRTDSQYSIELKYDGTRQFWLRSKLLSDRVVDNTLKFKHISSILKGLNAILDGEIYIFGKTVFDVSRKVNWDKVKYVVFDILELNGKDLRDLCLIDRQEILKKVLDKLNCNGIVHFPVQFSDVDVAWDFIEENKLEGLVIKDLKSFYSFKNLFEVDRRDTWVKVKYWKESKERIVSFDKGSIKGAFILENGSRLSALKSSVGEIFLKFKDVKPMYAEFQYLNKTESGAYFQPILKRIVDEKGEVIWE